MLLIRIKGVRNLAGGSLCVTWRKSGVNPHAEGSSLAPASEPLPLQSDLPYLIQASFVFHWQRSQHCCIQRQQTFPILYQIRGSVRSELAAVWLECWRDGGESGVLFTLSASEQRPVGIIINVCDWDGNKRFRQLLAGAWGQSWDGRCDAGSDGQIGAIIPICVYQSVDNVKINAFFSNYRFKDTTREYGKIALQVFTCRRHFRGHLSRLVQNCEFY